MRQRFRRAASFMVAVTLIGTIGYRLIEGAPWFDSFYMVVMTITTVGFLEVFPLSTLGRLWTVILIISGLGSVFYTASVGLELIVESTSISGRRRRLQRDIDRLSNHHILCGFGRVGVSVWQDLVDGGEDVVVIEINEDRFAYAESLGALVVLGDATSNASLDQAGIDRAASVMASVRNDADNLVICLSAKAIRNDVHVIARADEAESEEKLQLAGADRVVAPNRVGARRMAVMAMQRGFGDVIEFVMQGSRHFELRVERILVEGVLVGETLKTAAIRERLGAMVVGIDDPTSGVIINPDPDLMLLPGQSLVAIGTFEQLEQLRKLSVVDTASGAE